MNIYLTDGFAFSSRSVGFFLPVDPSPTPDDSSMELRLEQSTGNDSTPPTSASKGIK